jgi:tetratricopeptide (TPR) repeat protein
MLGRIERFEEAITWMDKLLSVNPQSVMAHTNKSLFLMKLGKIEEAEGWLQKAKAASRYDSKHLPYMNLGRIYAVRGLLIQAIKEFEQALEYSPGEPTCVAALSYLQRALH